MSDSCHYAALADWDRRPPEMSWSEATAVAVDSRDRVVVFNRGPHPVMIFDREGTLLSSWGEELFTRPHGITIGPDDALYLTDDIGHAVYKYSIDGERLLTLGTPGQPSDTGATSLDYRTVRRAGPPFHYPTNVALGPEGEIYVTDGYGNARVHKFSPEGRWLFSWGRPGAGAGEFNLPHGIATDPDGNLVVADRENSRLQWFSPNGEFLREMRDVARPCEVAYDRQGKLYIAELGYRAGMWPGSFAPRSDAPGGRLSVYDPQGQLVARVGGGENPGTPGDFFAPHDVTVDSRGDVYVAEVTMSAGGNRGLIPAETRSLQKFTSS